jgi:ATP-binding cassette subfamily B protein
MAAYLLLCLFDSLLFVLATLFTQRLLNEATLFVDNGSTIMQLVIALLFLAAVYILYPIIDGFVEYLMGYIALKSQGRMQYLLHRKASDLLPINYENIDTLEFINKASTGKDSSITSVLLGFMFLTFYIPYFAFMSLFLISMKPVLVAVLIFIFIPNLFSHVVRAKTNSKLEDEIVSFKRENEYYEKCMIHKEYYKETRLLGCFVHFEKLYSTMLHKLNQLISKASIKTNIIDFSMGTLTAAGYSAILFLLASLVQRQEISVGDFTAIFASLGRMYSIMSETMSRVFFNISKDSGKVKNFLKFLDIKETFDDTDYVLPASFDIKAENLTFHYPNSKHNALNNISLTIHAGEKIAIVGENGSGKSTLCRLLAGLYSPTTGQIYYNNKNNNEISKIDLYSKISFVFQNYNRYKLALSDNVFVSDTLIGFNEAKVLNSISDASLSIELFSEGLNTVLSPEFGGIDLSGGQWQRIAHSRAFYRARQIIFFDEPTSAIDPVEETEIYKKYADIAKGKTAFFVTHRLGMIKYVDKIIVMKNSAIVGFGAHHELIGNNSEYRRLYNAQKDWYS